MEIIQNILTSNNCYKSGKALNPKKLMVHSTAVPGAPAKNFLSSWNTAKPGGREVCVHGFVDDTGVYQTLPWTMQAWHCGGSGNQTAIGVEMCEPKDYGDRTYFDAVIKNAIQLYAYLAKTYGISISNIVSHTKRDTPRASHRITAIRITGGVMLDIRWITSARMCRNA